MVGGYAITFTGAVTGINLEVFVTDNRFMLSPTITVVGTIDTATTVLLVAY
ncbi:hypothetical protein [Paenisporosarcina indica]|uniref:hypothetical protein n=1 Tax=Paenisporosarcina indica TaxID=650093 RepID=UPI001B8010C9|nr:hypothetical protein [Paenisporosarcina indica]